MDYLQYLGALIGEAISEGNVLNLIINGLPSIQNLMKLMLHLNLVF